MDIDPVEALTMLRVIGLNLSTENGRLLVGPSDLLDDDLRWFIRKHRDGLIEAIHRADKPAWAWRVEFDGFALEVYCHPDKTRAEVHQMYPTASRVDLLPASQWPRDVTKRQAA
jgi:hypothetical protein